jgi:hypothetical protein
MKARLLRSIGLASVLVLVASSCCAVGGGGADVTYTSSADFDQGTLVSVNHDAPNNDQLQLDSPTEPFPFINIAASGRGTVVRVNTDTGEVVGEYRTAPEGRGLNPSRTTVDLFGNVWTANRGEVGEVDGVPHGSAVKIGLIVGGTRVDSDGTADEAGGYLAPPFGYSTCVDRDGDGLIRTSSGLSDVLDWPDNTDGLGGVDGVVEDAVDECVLVYQRLPDAELARHVSVDADNNVWVGGYPSAQRQFHKLDGNTGAILDSFDARDFGCGGYGGLIDRSGILWSIGGGPGEGTLLRYDPTSHTGSCVDTFGGYGLGVDTNGYLWTSLWDNGIVKVSPDGVVEPGFPKSTLPSTSAAAPAGLAGPAGLTSGTSTSEAVALADPGTMPQEAPPDSLSAALPVVAAADGAPSFTAVPDSNWVGSTTPWTPGSTVTLTIEDGGGPAYSDSRTADPEGWFNFNLGGVFDLQRGQVVTVTDGTTTKSHEVLSLYADTVDVAADTVTGRADPGSEARVWVYGTGPGIDVTADGSGVWTADFSGVSDLTSASNGTAEQTDEDGDVTWDFWAPSAFTVAPDDNWVGSMTPWTPGSTVTLTIEDSGGATYSDTRTVDPEGSFNFNLWGAFDLQRGQVVTVTDGTTTKSHQVLNLYAEAVDVAADTVTGRADPGAEVRVSAWGNDTGASIDVTADGSGVWTADFSGVTDLTADSDGTAQQTDEDGDSTWDSWATPSFEASPDDDWVSSTSPWSPGSSVTLTIEDGGGLAYSDSQTVDPEGRFNFDLWNAFDLERGQVVTVTDGTTTKSHQVLDLYADVVDVAADTVTGRADPGAEVRVWVHETGAGVDATADGSGVWTADFSGVADLTATSNGNSQQTDEDGDATWDFWATPSFEVSPDDERVQSLSRWSPGSTVTLTVEDGGEVVYTDSQTVDPEGWFNFSPGGALDLQRGQVVTVTDGTTTKSHQVLNLYADVVDVAADTVTGRADPGAEVRVWVDDTDAVINVTADGSGSWTADFSGVSDLTYASRGNSQQTDEDGDATWDSWSTPSFQVEPDDDRIGSMTPWTPGSTVTLTIEEGGGAAYSGSQTVDSRGSFNVSLSGQFDIRSGQVVTVTDGTITKSLLLTNPDLTETDVAADRVSGTAEPLATLEVRAAPNSWSEGSTREVTADAAGVWTADFSIPSGGFPSVDLDATTVVSVYERDDDGDATHRDFGPSSQANRGVAVTPVDNNVWVANSGVGTVTRLDNDGEIVAVIETGDSPTGVAVDASGKVWVTNLGSDNAVRIDPDGGADGLGAVDLTVDLGPGASPYNYSDMTGAVVVGSTSPQGFWTVTQDSGEAGSEWGRLTWNTEPEASEPAGSEIVVEIRTSDTEAGLGGQAFVPVSNGELFSSFGRFIEVRVTLKASPDGLSPVLSDIRVQPAETEPAGTEVAVDIKPGSYPNSINIKRTTGVIAVAVLGGDDFDVSTIDVASLRFGPDQAVPAHDLRNPMQHVEDVDGDGYLDLVSHYVVGETGLEVGDTEACLIGATLGGTPIEGCDSVRVFER